MNLLIVEDETPIVQHLSRGLVEDGYEVHVAGTVAEGKVQLAAQAMDLVLLDRGLPGEDGLVLLEYIREEFPHIPVIILTARDGVEDRVAGLRGGADDYMVKPFSYSELLARIEAVLRRTGKDDRMATDGVLTVNRLERIVSDTETSLELTQREADLLWYFMSNRDRVVSREELSDKVWKVQSRATPMDNVIEVTLSRLRGKLKESFGRPGLETVRGLGYRYQP